MPEGFITNPDKSIFNIIRHKNAIIIIIIIINIIIIIRWHSTGYKIREGYKLTPWLMDPGDSMPHSQGPLNITYPEPNQPNSRIDTYLFKISINTVIKSMPTPS